MESPTVRENALNFLARAYFLIVLFLQADFLGRIPPLSSARGTAVTTNGHIPITKQETQLDIHMLPTICPACATRTRDQDQRSVDAFYPFIDLQSFARYLPSCDIVSQQRLHCRTNATYCSNTSFPRNTRINPT